MCDIMIVKENGIVTGVTSFSEGFRPLVIRDDFNDCLRRKKWDYVEWLLKRAVHLIEKEGNTEESERVLDLDEEAEGLLIEWGVPKPTAEKGD